MNGEQIIKLCLSMGFGDARLCRDDEGKLRLLTAYPYLFAQSHGDARVSSFYFASQRSYRLVNELAQRLTQLGIPARRDETVRLKPLALKYGLGVQGRNSLVIHPRFGSQMALGCLLLETDLDVPAPGEIRRCEDCGLCRTACPAGALDEFGQVDLTRCLRMFMISGKPYPEELRPLLENRLLGCDDCQLCCPHNAGKSRSGGDGEPSLYALLAGDKMTFQKLKEDVGTNFARKNRILAQALLCAADRGDPGLRPLVEPYLSHTDEAIRAHAAWCLDRFKEKGF